jgi:hypothetical protein
MAFDIHGLKVLICLPLAALAMGCSTSATISLRSAPQVEGKIVSADTESVYVKTEQGTQPVDRSQITDIDHPGNVAGTIGAVVTAYGVVNAVIGAPNCEKGGAAYCIGVFTPAAIGLPLMIWGFTTWSLSKDAADPKATKDGPRVSVLPAASLEKKNAFVGGSVSVTY